MLEFFPIPFLSGLAVLVPLLMILWRMKRPLSYLICFALFWVYFLAVVSVTVFPIPLSENPLGLWTKQQMFFTLSHVNLKPFNYLTFFNRYVLLREIIRNILLTTPFGFGIRFFRRFSLKEMIWLAIIPGLLIEITQLAVSLGLAGAYRGVDLTDLILNTLGVWLGYGLFHLLAHSLRTYRRFNYQLLIANY